MSTNNSVADWEDDRIGVPTVGHAPTPIPRSSVNESWESLELREGETELGRPAQIPSALAMLTDEDRKHLRRMEDEQAARDLAEAEMLLASDPSGMGWLGWFGSPLALTFLLGWVGWPGSSYLIRFFNSSMSSPAILSGRNTPATPG